jgi:hypothetical protein
MSPRTLFIIILRVLGILSLKELFTAIPQLISTVALYFEGYSISGGLFMVVISLLTVVLFLWISYILIFKADYLVSNFGLDQNFTESTLNLNINSSSVLRIAIIVTGTLLLIYEIPEFCRIAYSLLQERHISFLRDGSPDWSPAVYSGVKIILALLIIGERNRILQFLEKPKDSEQGENI